MRQARRWRLDAVSVLTLYLLVLVAVPSQMRVAALGAAGTPAQLIALAAFAWWLYHTFQRTLGTSVGVQPVRIAFLAFWCAALLSYIVAALRPMDAEEATSADFAMLTMAAWSGIVLLSNDGIPSRARFDLLLQRIVAAGGALATLAAIQFVTGRPWTDKLSIPGLSVRHDLYSFATRAGFDRPSGTALHPIEFGAVITMVLPLAIVLAMHDHGRSRLRKWYPVAAIAIATLMSISRSALLCAVLGMIILASSWRLVTQAKALLATMVLAAAAFVAIPGMLGSLAKLFTGIDQDSSARSRADSVGLAFEFVQREPWFGRGLFTFLPRYRILDDQYLLLLVEVGVVGLLAVLGLVGAAVHCARASRRRSRDERTAQLGQALFASTVAGAAGFALFDGFGFPMSAGMFFLLLGLTGALWRLVREEEAVPVVSTGPSTRQDRARATELGGPPVREQQ